MTTLTYEMAFTSTKGLSWPSVKILYNDNLIGDFTFNKKNSTISFDLNKNNAESEKNSLTIHYYNKTENETICKDGRIIGDQSLELNKIYVDGILLETWFYTEHYYYPLYFSGFLQQFPKSLDKIKSQLLWHFPGKYIINNLPSCDNFWSWYQQNRQQRVLEDLIDPSGQLLNNLRGLTQEDYTLLNEIKAMLNV